MSDTTLTATLRTEFGKGAARRARRAGSIPAVLYGHGTDPVHLLLPAHDTFLALKGHANALLTIQVEGRSELALAKDVQREPVKAVIEHVDLVLVRKGERVEVEVPVHVVGEPAPGAIAAVDHQVIKITADATEIPERIDVALDGAEAGTVIRAGDLSLPRGTELHLDPEAVVVAVTLPAAEEPEPEAGADVALAEATEQGAAEPASPADAHITP